MPTTYFAKGWSPDGSAPPPAAPAALLDAARRLWPDVDLDAATVVVRDGTRGTLLDVMVDHAVLGRLYLDAEWGTVHRVTDRCTSTSELHAIVRSPWRRRRAPRV